jgi:hypothetical protein
MGHATRSPPSAACVKALRQVADLTRRSDFARLTLSRRGVGMQSSGG